MTTENAQDAFAQLVEDCRTGLLNRIIITPEKALFIPHKSGLDLSDLPVFYMGEMAFAPPAEADQFGRDALNDGTFRLPYDRCAFMYFLVGDHPAISSLAHHRGVSRYYLLLCEQHDDGVLVAGFVKPANHDHWGKQTWQALVSVGGDEPGVELSLDPTVHNLPGAFKEDFLVSSTMRVMVAVADIHRIMMRGGRANHAAGTIKTDKINARRERIDLPPVPRIRIIDFDAPNAEVPTRPVASDGGSGITKAPHYRRGTWRTLASGRRVPVKACAIHGGSTIPPPWYEVRAH